MENVSSTSYVEVEVPQATTSPVLSSEIKGGSKHDIVIEKSENDDRSYRALTLENGLKVLLISDSKSEKAAACLAVGVGSLSDPDDLPGLAHFCEHMILLGSAKYPEESAYSKFVSSHSGFCNAFTSMTETCFVFDIAAEFIYEALERFADLFVSPLFTESATEREVNAVDSEHEKNLSNDSRRVLQIDKLLCNQDHDYSKFTTGNKETLFENPKLRSVNVREELVKFHAKYYSSNIMALTILSRESLDTMEKRFTTLFARIPNIHATRRSWTVSPWTDEYLRKKIYVVPVRNYHELRLVWPIKDYTNFYKSAPTRYLTHLLGHEATGSLLSALKHRSLATEILVEAFRPGDGFACLIIYINITDHGLECIDDIIKMTFQYINMVRRGGIQKWILDEEREMQVVRFRFKSKEEPFDYVYRLAPRMFKFPFQDLLTVPYMSSEFRPDLTGEVLESLTPDRVRCFIVSRNVADRCTEFEKIYKTRYGHESIPEEILEAWRNCGVLEEMHLPPPNPYLPSDFSLRCETSPDTEDLAIGPRILLDNAGARLWFKQDQTFRLPKTFMNVNIISSIGAQDPVHDLMLHLFAGLFDDSVNEDAYLCSLAGLCFNISANPPSLRLSFVGYSHKMELLIATILERLACFSQPDRQRLDVLLRKLEQRIRSFPASTPVEQADGFYSSALFDRSYTHEERLAALSHITYEDLLLFIPGFFSRVYIESLVYGNASAEEALNFGDIVTKAFKKHKNWRPPVCPPSPHMREVEIPTGKAHIYKRINHANSNSAILVYYQNSTVGMGSCAMHRLFDQIIREPAFNQLRTEKQLGYIVRAVWHISNSSQGINVIIQSKYHPQDLDHHIETFMAGVEKMIENMSEDEYQVHVNSVVASLLEKPKQMSQQASRYWSQIIRQRYEFDKNEREAEIIRLTKKEEVLEFYRKFMKSTSEHRRKMAIYVISESAPAASNEAIGVEIKDLRAFKRSLPLRPIVPPHCLDDFKTKTSASVSLDGIAVNGTCERISGTD